MSVSGSYLENYTLWKNPNIKIRSYQSNLYLKGKSLDDLNTSLFTENTENYPKYISNPVSIFYNKQKYKDYEISGSLLMYLIH